MEHTRVKEIIKYSRNMTHRIRFIINCFYSSKLTPGFLFQTKKKRDNDLEHDDDVNPTSGDLLILFLYVESDFKMNSSYSNRLL